MESNDKNLSELNDLLARYRRERSFESWSSEEKEAVKDNLTYHSNKIEGLTLSYGDTLKFLRDNLVHPGARLKDLYDLKNYRTVLDLIFASYDEILLTEDRIKQLHAELMKDDAQWEVQDAFLAGPGEYKTENNYTNRPGGYHMYMEYAMVPAAMRSLIVETNQALKSANDNDLRTHSLSVIAKFHFKFLEIHPFSDGNGRVARLLTTLLLIKHKFPPIVIEGDERERYFDALIRSEQDDNQSPIVFFFLYKLTNALVGSGQ